MSMKNSNDIIGNQTRDLPACIAVHQPAAPRCTSTEGEWRRDVQNYSGMVRLARTPRNHGNDDRKIRDNFLDYFMSNKGRVSWQDKIPVIKVM